MSLASLCCILTKWIEPPVIEIVLYGHTVKISLYQAILFFYPSNKLLAFTQPVFMRVWFYSKQTTQQDSSMHFMKIQQDVPSHFLKTVILAHLVGVGSSYKLWVPVLPTLFWKIIAQFLYWCPIFTLQNTTRNPHQVLDCLKVYKKSCSNH